MSGVSMKISVLDEEIERFLKSELARMGNLRPFYVNVGEHLLNSVQERFDTQSVPDGTPWQRLAPSTVENRLRKHGNAEITILRERGRRHARQPRLRGPEHDGRRREREHPLRG